MTGPPPATAAVRLAVRRALVDLPEQLVVAAVSGGADSLALAAALAFERPGSGVLVVDHQLQPGSAEVAARAAEQCRQLGLLAEVLTAASPSSGNPQSTSTGDCRQPGGSGGGPEASAREVRYRLLAGAADRRGAVAVLLGHTLDDQAETVLLGLARGSGARALAGMAPVRGRYRRPLLDLPRATTRAACAEAGLCAWDDPHNDDPAYLRVRVRRLLPVVEQAIGPGIVQALARSARSLREDADALDALAVDTGDVALLAALPPAVRSRSLKLWAEERSGRGLTAVHVEALRALVDAWHGQGPVGLPGGSTVIREGRALMHRPPG